MFALDFGASKFCISVWRNNNVEIIPNNYESITTSTLHFNDFHEEEHKKILKEGIDTKLLYNEELNEEGEIRFINEISEMKTSIKTWRKFHKHLFIGDSLRNGIYSYKRFIEKNFSELINNEEEWKLNPFPLLQSNEDEIFIQLSLNGISNSYTGEIRNFSIYELFSIILKKSKKIAEKFCGFPMQKILISVPDYYTEKSRMVLYKSAYLANLKAILVNNSKAALAQLIRLNENSLPDRIFIYEMGSTSTIASIYRKIANRIELIAVYGDNIGGEDFTNNLMIYLISEFQINHNVDIRNSSLAIRKLRNACEKAKKDLSLQSNVIIEIDCLYNAIDFRMTITRDLFEILNEKLYQRGSEIMMLTTHLANINPFDIRDVFLTGGATRMPKIKEFARNYFQREPSTQLNANESIAYGLAALSSQYNDKSFDDLSPLYSFLKSYFAEKIQIIDN